MAGDGGMIPYLVIAAFMAIAGALIQLEEQLATAMKSRELRALGLLRPLPLAPQPPQLRTLARPATRPQLLHQLRLAQLPTLVLVPASTAGMLV